MAQIGIREPGLIQAHIVKSQCFRLKIPNDTVTVALSCHFFFLYLVRGSTQHGIARSPFFTFWQKPSSISRHCAKVIAALFCFLATCAHTHCFKLSHQAEVKVTKGLSWYAHHNRLLISIWEVQEVLGCSQSTLSSKRHKDEDPQARKRANHRHRNQHQGLSRASE